MNRTHWKDLLEGIGFIAIIVSLIFVGIESRNSTKQAILTNRALEIASYQELMTNIEAINTLAVESEAAASVLSEIWGETGDLNKFRQTRALYNLYRHGDVAYFMYERGAIDEDRLLSALAPLPIYTQIGRDFWDERKHSFTGGYRDYIDRLIASKKIL